MSRFRWLLLVLALLSFRGCGVIKEVLQPEAPKLSGMEGLIEYCSAADTIRSILISKAEAVLMFDNERYEVTITLYSKRDSIIYLSAVNSGFEILRASVKHDSIKVINRLNRIVYRSPLIRRFGYQYPVSFEDLQNLITNYYLCDNLKCAHDDLQNYLIFDLDEDHIKKRIMLSRSGGDIKKFEFYHQQTERYLMGERVEEAFKIYSNFIITEFEILASDGVRTFNREIEVNMEVNPRRYTFTEVR